LDETYERVLKEIMTANQHQAYRLLQCLTVASRPLRVEELAEILAIDFDGAKEGIPELKEDWRWKDQQEAVLSTCSSLIAVVDDGSHRVVQFSHFSVKEFLTSDRLAASSTAVSHFRILLEPAHTVIVKACLGILLQSDNGASDAKPTRNSPLAEYAAMHWVGHAQFGDVSAHIEVGMRRLFDVARPYFEAWLELHDIDTDWYSFVDYDRFPGKGRRGFPLYYASLCGFHDLTAYLVSQHPQHLNAKLGKCLSPLVAALHRRHFDIAEQLFQRGADVGIRGRDDRTLLHAASEEGSVDVAQWLLAHGAGANERANKREMPLHLAARDGRFQFDQMLLRHGMIVDAKTEDNRTSLHLASDGGHVEIVRLLLQHGADVATQDLRFSTPLHLASSWVSVKTARFLLQHRTDVKEQRDDVYHRRGPNANTETIQVLLEHGADVTARDDTHSTPLHLAASNTSPEIVRLLIKHGADINTLDGNRKMPLYLALSEGSHEIARMLIELGADVTTRNDTHTTPLHLASSARSPEIARLLIKHGADVNVSDLNGEVPLHLALAWVSVTTARFL
jgi:ankyrin repeat protein